VSKYTFTPNDTSKQRAQYLLVNRLGQFFLSLISCLKQGTALLGVDKLAED